jgi:two-component system, NarL family, response regulator NreC
MKNIKIGIADDQVIFRLGLANLLNTFPSFSVCISASSGRELLNQLKTIETDIVIIDFRMPELNGLQTAMKVRRRFPEIKILILSMYDDHVFVIKGIEHGANGYLSKDSDAEEIEKAIHSAINTGYYLNDKTTKHLVHQLVVDGKIIPSYSQDMLSFNSQELQIVKLICMEHTTPEIADIMCKSTRTIEGIRAQVMQKIGARNIIGVVMYAMKHNLLEEIV